VFVAAIIALLPRLEKQWVLRHIARQLARSASGGGRAIDELMQE
jgi:hypothetical protein